MAQTEVTIVGVATANLMSLITGEKISSPIGTDLFGFTVLKEKNGPRCVMLPLDTLPAIDLIDLYKKRSSKGYTVKQMLVKILGDKQKRYSKKKITIPKIVLSASNGKLQTALFIKELNAFEIDKHPCQLFPALILHLIGDVKMLVDDELFDLWINFDLTIKNISLDSQEARQHSTLRERLQNMPPEDFGGFHFS